jgi:hypothetical protein
MRKILLFIGLLLASPSLTALPYAISVKKQGKEPIRKLVVLAERCSGSNYIESLILSNLELTSAPFCHKHFPPWYELPISQYRGDPQHYHFANTADHLFVVIFRNPYDWVRSLYQTPHHGLASLQRVDFNRFIRSIWIHNPIDPLMNSLRASHPLIDRDPIDGSLFKNVLKLRTAKIKNMLKIRQRAKNVYFINYEVARDYPQEVLEEIRETFRISPKPSYFTPVVYYKGKKNLGRFVKKEYTPITPQDLSYINSQLDDYWESIIGYPLIRDPKALN